MGLSYEAHPGIEKRSCDAVDDDYLRRQLLNFPDDFKTAQGGEGERHFGKRNEVDLRVVIGSHPCQTLMVKVAAAQLVRASEGYEDDIQPGQFMTVKRAP